MSKGIRLSIAISEQSYRQLLLRGACQESPARPLEELAAVILEDALLASAESCAAPLDPRPEFIPNPWVEVVARITTAETTTRQVAMLGGLPLHRLDRSACIRIGHALRDAGWKVGGQRGTVERERFYVRPDVAPSPSSAPPEPASAEPTSPAHH